MRRLGVLLLVALSADAGQHRLSDKTEYEKYIGTLIHARDLGTTYSEDGSADASVLDDSRMPHQAVAALVQLGSRALPLLIDCLNDGRLTSATFSGNAITREMKVPVGFVCLDILTNITQGPIHYPGCADDGFGACVHFELYFRPDDYEDCIAADNACLPRPWVMVVQRNWRRLYLQKRILFYNPLKR